MKYLKLFNNHSEYTESVEGLAVPNVVCCDSEDHVHYNPIPPDYNVVRVDLGLPSGLLWADRNIGADAPYEIGDYYSWAETEVKNDHRAENYKYYNGSSYTKYREGDILQPMDDAASALWGGEWHTPTKEDILELRSGTTSAATVVNGVSGITLTSTANGNSIFIPACGMWFYCTDARQCGGATGETLSDTGSCLIWSSTLDGWGEIAWHMNSWGDGWGVENWVYRSSAIPVRPVWGNLEQEVGELLETEK